MKIPYVLKIAVNVKQVPHLNSGIGENSTYCKLELYIWFADIFSSSLDYFICVWKSPASDDCFCSAWLFC